MDRIYEGDDELETVKENVDDVEEFLYENETWEAVKEQGQEENFKTLADSLSNTAKVTVSSPDGDSITFIFTPDQVTRSGDELKQITIKCTVEVNGVVEREETTQYKQSLSKSEVAQIAVLTVEDLYEEIV